MARPRKADRRIKRKALFSPSTHATHFHEFVMGVMIGAFLGGIGGTLATICIKGLIKKYVKDKQSALALGVQ